MSETPETTMRPEDVAVPVELCEMFPKELKEVGGGFPLLHALAAVLPAHRAMVLEAVACQPPGVAVLTEEDLAARDAEIEQRVRAKVAEEIEQRRPSSTTPGPRHKHYWMGMTRAAHIARGEQP